MKKLLCLVLALATVLSMAVLFTSCGEEEPTTAPTKEATAEPTNGSTAEPTAEATDASTTEPTDEATEDSTAKEELKMVTNAYFAPYEFFEGDQIVGIDAEIAAAIAQKMGRTLKIESINFDSIISSVNAGAADFGMAGITVTEERLTEVDFSLSYATGCQMLVVKKDSTLTSLDDLVAYPADEDGNYITEGNTATKIGVQLGTTGALYAEWDGYNAIPYTTANDAIIALKKGDVDCVMIDSAPAQNFVNSNEDLRMIDGSEAYIVEEYAICVKKGNEALLNEINAAIVALMEDGTIDAIIEKYIPAE